MNTGDTYNFEGYIFCIPLTSYVFSGFYKGLGHCMWLEISDCQLKISFNSHMKIFPSVCVAGVI